MAIRNEYNYSVIERKDYDYSVIARRILSYLYDCLKGDRKVYAGFISFEWLGISENYYNNILYHLFEDGYIESRAMTVFERSNKKTGIMITPKGIEFLQENS